MKRHFFVFALIISGFTAYGQCNAVITGPTLVCAGTQSRYYASSTPQGNFSWTVNGGHIVTGTPTTPQIQWTNPGTWQISVTNTLCPGSPATIYNVTVVNASTINAPTLISGTDINCAGTTSVYSVPSVAGLVPVWYIVPQNSYSSPDIPTLTPSGNQVSITWPAGSSSSYALYASYSNGTCTGQQTYKNLTTVAGTVMPSISGSTNLCQGQSILYSATSEVQDTYTWSVTGGNTILSNGNQATVQWINQGTFMLTVTATNACNATPKITTKTIQVGAQLSTPGTISKQNSMTCINQTERYSVSPVAGATSYIWTGTLSSGNWEVTTTTPYHERAFSSLTSGTISVRVSNGICESQSSPDFIVNVGPPQLGLTIPPSTCVGTPVTATITSSSIDLTGLPVTWNVGVGQILSYPTGNSAVIKWNSPNTGTDISAIVVTPCGSFAAPGPLINPPRIEIHDASLTTYPITGTTQACLGTYTYSMANSPGMNVAWDILYQGGGSTGFGFSTVTNGIQIGWSTPGNYTVKATITNACGTSQVRTLNVTVTSGPKPTTGYINGSSSEYLCLDFPNTRNYSVTPTGGINYTWGVQGLPGDVITASGNSANITWTGEAYSQVYVTPSTATCTGEKTLFYSTHYANSAIGTLSSTGPASACTYAPVPITLSVTSATGYVRYQVRKKGDNGAWTAWTEFNGPDYTIDYSLPEQPVYSAYYYEFQAIARNSTCAPAYSNVISFTGYVTPYFSNPSSYFDPKSICSGTTVSVIPTSNTPGTTIAWTSSVTGPVTGASASGAGNISNVLTNTGSTIGTVTYSITPSANGCTSMTYTIIQYVYPDPVVTPGQTKTVCSGSAADYNIIVIPEVELNWPDPDGSGPATSVSNRNWTPDILDQLTNTGTSPLLVTYQVTPFYRINGSLGCSGATANVVITVNPKPVMTSPASGVGCNNVPLNHPLASNIPSTYTWYAANNIYTTGESLSVQSSAVINNSISTSSQQTVNYTVTPTSTNGCLGNSQNVSMLVNVSPAATITPSSTSICANGSVILNANTGAGLSYQWFKAGVSIPGVTASSYTASSVGSYTVQVTNSSTGCSNVSTPTVVSLVKCSQTITFGALLSNTYGDASFSLNATASSGLPVTYTSSNSSVATISGNTVTITGAGTATITASQAGNVDFFAATSVQQTLTVTKAMLIATASSPYRTYGAANPAFTISYAGFVNGETASVIDIAPTASTTATLTSNVGTYPITPAGGSDNNYTFNYVNGTLTVNKATLQVTADNKTRTYGSVNPTFTVSYAGFVNGETASVVDTPPTGSTTAVSTTETGNYAIVPSGGIDNNYSFNYINGTLTIAKAAILATSNMSRPYNTANPTFIITYTGLKNGETSYVIDSPPTASTTATLSSPVGSYPITLSGGTDNNYAISLATGSLSVTKANQTVTFSPIPTKCGTGTVSLVATASSGLVVTFASSNTSIATISGSSANALQTGTVTITATQAGNGNYNSASATQSLVIASLPARPSITQIGCVCDQYVTLQASGGSNYVWSTGYAGQTVNMVTSADYYVTSTGANGCSRQSFLFTAIIPPCSSDPCGGGPQSRTGKDIQADVSNAELQVTEATVYPNPADASLTIHLLEGTNQNLHVSLYSQYGQEVNSAVLAKGEHKIDLDTKLLSKGMYILMLRTSTGRTLLNRKVLITH